MLKAAKWCNKYLNPLMFGGLFLIFGTLIYTNHFLISSFVIIGILLIATTFDRMPNDKDNQARRMYLTIASVISITIFNLICFSFMSLEFGVISNSLLSVPFFVILYRNYHNLNLDKLYEQDPSADFDQKIQNEEFKKYFVNTLVGVWVLFGVCVAIYIFGKTGPGWISVYLPIMLFAAYFTIRQITLSIIFHSWIGAKTWRLVFNIVCIFMMVILTLLLSNDGAWGSDHIEFYLFPLVGITILFYFPFKTGHAIARKDYLKKKKERKAQNNNLQ